MKTKSGDKRWFGVKYLCLQLRDEEGNSVDLSGSEDDDMLDVPPGEARAHLQHEGHHSGRQGRCG